MHALKTSIVTSEEAVMCPDSFKILKGFSKLHAVMTQYDFLKKLSISISDLLNMEAV
jgi:hypothetical protein